MAEHELRASLVVSQPIDEAFGFFSDVANLERITPPELRFQILTPPPVVMQQGTLIDYQIALFGLPFRWQTLISQWEPPFRFVDEQLRGPYALWVHEHRFEAEAPRSTRISDYVRYRLPLAPLGDVVLPIVRRQLAHIFAYRETQVAARLGR
jgi:ligand-binding SRPBCC domain-containing protein